MKIDSRLKKALTLNENGQLREAEILFKQILKNNPKDFVSLYTLANIELKLGTALKALEYIDRAIKIKLVYATLNSFYALAWDCRGFALQALSRNDEALESYDCAIKVDSGCTLALLHRGVLLQNMGQHVKALECYSRLLEIEPDHKSALTNIGLVYTNLKHYKEAISSFARLLQISPEHNYTLGSYCFAKQLACKWDLLDACTKSILEGVAAGKHVCSPAGLHTISDSPHEHQLGAQLYGQHKFPSQTNLWRGEKYEHNKIRIAYLSPDLREHPVTHLMAGILESHDKTRFETIALSLGGNDNSRIRCRIESCFDKFIEVRHLNSKDIAELMRSLEVDIAVDLGGYTLGSRPDIFSRRPAPIQVNYLGYPGTMGVDYMDYILADRWIIPETDRQYYNEKVAYLPDCYLPYDASLKIADRTPIREEFGLPSDGFVFCSFNNIYKVTPETFDVWMRLLKETPKSVLWLMKLNIYAEANLQRETELRGVDPGRLIFAARTPEVEDHLARYRLADLFLDTTPYNAHTTAIDALFAGLPVLTCMGHTFPGRVAGSLLHVIGMPELITGSLREYADLALKLTRDRAQLERLKHKLLLNRDTFPLFDTKRYCRHLESAYISMWERQQSGERPESFAVLQHEAVAKTSISNPEISTAPEVADDVNTGMSGEQKLTQALAFQNNGELHKAEAIFRQLLTESPNDIVPLYSLGVIALKLGEQEKSLKYFDAAAEQAPGFQQTWFNRGVVLQALGRHSEALASYNRALQINPAYSQAQANRDALAEIVERENEAIATVRSANTESMHVAFDISVLGLGHFNARARTGIYRVVDNLLGLLAERADICLRLVAYPNLVNASAEFIHARANLSGKYVVENFSSIQPGELYHSPFYPLPPLLVQGPQILTVYDLIPIKLPELFEFAEGNTLRNTINSLGADGFVTVISESTKVDLCEFAPHIDPDRITVTTLAADPKIFYPCSDPNEKIRIEEKYGLGSSCRYLLSVATLEPRKNIAHLIRAFVRLLRDDVIVDLKLVLVGTKGWKFDGIFAELSLAEEIRDRIVLTEFVPDEDMAALYSNAIAFAYPSLYEGFGLPPLEAMQCGTPVITSGNSSLPEVVGDAGILVSADDEDALVAAIRSLYTNEPLRQDLSQRGIARAAGFTWTRCVEQTVAAYKSAFEHWQAKFGTVMSDSKPIVIDAVFFQTYQTGIARVWRSLLREWSGTDFGRRLIVLDRDHTAPRFEGLTYIDVPRHDYADTDNDRLMLQRVCDERNAALFISSYYTTPITTPSVFMAYDMLPELLKWDTTANIPMWREKHIGVRHASRFVTISQNTAKDLRRFFPNIAREQITVTHCGVDFKAPESAAIAAFRTANGIERPYFLLVGARNSYKNTILFFQAFAALGDARADYAIVCTGPELQLEKEYVTHVGGASVNMLNLNDSDLQAAYAGALALVYPSLYEGFGMPIIEAMACGCPVITTRGGSIPEVAKDAVLYVGVQDISGMTKALIDVQNKTVRNSLVAAGLERVKAFSWEKMAGEVRQMLEKSVEELTGQQKSAQKCS